jgi:hypothetical protein
MMLYFCVLYQNLITRVPPYMISNLFGNDMHLTEENVSFVLDWCDPEFPPKNKYYVYRMTHSSVMKKKCKLVR